MNKMSAAAATAATTATAVATKRGHIRSASLENGNSFISKNTLGLPPTPAMQQPAAGHTGTLKSRNEQKRLRGKFGSHNNLMDDYAQQGRSKFQNIRQMFELSKRGSGSGSQKDVQMYQSLPATALVTNQQQQQQLQHMQMRYQLQSQPQPQSQSQSQQRKATPTTTAAGCGNRGSIADLNERLNINESMEIVNSNSHHNNNAMRQQQQQQQQQQQRSASGMAHLQHDAESAANNATTLGFNAADQSAAATATATATATNTATTALIRPIAFKPIPFEPDYSIPNRYCDVVVGVDRYGSTPSLLAPAQDANLRFGSTTDLRHGGVGVGAAAAAAAGIGIGAIGTGAAVAAMNSSHSSIAVPTVAAGAVAAAGNAAIAANSLCFVGGAYSSNNYCNSLMARRRGAGSRSLKINDSMESIRHTPDLEANSQSSNIKNNNASNNNSHNNDNNNNHNAIANGNGEQCDMTPSPSDSGISDLEAALKDRDSELSYLRQTMEHNEKVIFKVQKDKQTFWENETKRLKCFYEGQQREYLLKLKKMEQMLAMQQFQFKQHKLKHHEQLQKLREQAAELKNDNEILRSHNSSLRSSERNLKDRAAYIEEQLEETQQSLNVLNAQLEESEWKVCERNGEIALLKTQLKEANLDISMKQHALVHLKQETNNAEHQRYQSLQQQQTKRQSGDTELQQLNKIVILKDQVILALTNELGKLRKELSDLAISQEYGEEPSGKYTRLKQQLDHLTEICKRSRRNHTKEQQKEQQQQQQQQPLQQQQQVIDDNNLELIMNCLKIAPTLLEHNGNSEEERELCNNKVNAEQRLAKMSADIQNFVYGSSSSSSHSKNTPTLPPQQSNLPDVAAVNAKINKQLQDVNLDTLIEESANYAEQIAKLRQQLDDVRDSFELEKGQWAEEREKVLSYQRQLQAHYINMYQKLRSLEASSGDEV